MNSKTVLIEENEAWTLLNSLDILALVGEAFSLQSNGMVRASPRDVLEGGTKSHLLGTMPGFIVGGPYAGFGVKTISVDLNPKKITKNGSHQGYLILYGDDSSSDNFIIDAAPITELRTAAASALATKLMCKKKDARVSIIGTGLQAKSHITLLNRYNGFTRFMVFARNEDSRHNFEKWLDTNMNVSCVVSTNFNHVIDSADVICTATAATEPFLTSAMLPSECHINAIGSSTPKFQELSSDVASDAYVIVDSVEACMKSSAFLCSAVKENIINESDIVEIGSLIGNSLNNGSKKSRTIFNSVGIIAQDLVFGKAISEARL